MTPGRAQPPGEPSTTRRREPRQERSRLRVERILAAARAILDESGPAGITMRAVANRAQVPVATIYQFFTDREGLIEELIHHDVEAREDEFRRLLDPTAPTTIAEAVDQVFAAHISVFRPHPQLVDAYYAGDRGPRIETIRAHRRRLAQIVADLMVGAGLLPPSTPAHIVELAVELGDRGIEYAHTGLPENAQDILAETRIAVIAYLDTVAARSATPDDHE